MELFYQEKDCPIKLKPHQVDHVRNIWNLIIHDQAFSFIDTSTTGLGKTFSALCIAWWLQHKFKVKVMIVAPSDTSLNNDDGWLHWAKEYGIAIEESTTYSKLIGKNNKVKHPWLIPHKEKKKWIASQEFSKLCAYGLFIIFDEYHRCKNRSITHYACAALVREAKKYRKRSRVGLLSHTPGDKPGHYPQILRMSGLTTSVQLYRHVPFTSEYEWENHGFGEIARTCKKIAKNDAASAVIENAMTKISAARANGICKELYDTYIKKLITFAMPVPKKTIKVELVNAFLETDPTSLEFVNQGIAMLGRAVRWNGQDVGDRREWNLGGITNGLKRIEEGKLLSIVNYVRKQSRLFPNKKFVICCGARGIKNHHAIQKLLYKEYCPDSVRKVFYELKKSNPISKDVIDYMCDDFVRRKVHADVLNGKVKKKDRVEIIRRFQEDSNDSWCLIVSPGIGSESINLQDCFGNHPREMLIIPDYYFSRVIQSAGRINRVNTKSDVKVMMVYSKEGNMETSLLNSMIRKTKTAKDLLAEDQEVLFPGEYPFWIQGKKDPELERELKRLQDTA